MPITTTPSGGAQGEFSTYTPIYSTTLTSSVSTINFNNIPQDYTDLVIVSNFFVSATDYTSFRLNDDSTSSYSHLKFYDNGSSTVGGSMGNNLTGFLNTHYGLTSANNAMGIFSIMNYSNPSVFKTILVEDSYGAPNEHTFVVGTWRNSSPVSSVRMTRTSGNFTSGSTFNIYGIKAATPAPKATGGDVINTDGTYWYHAYTTTGVFTPSTTSLSCDILQVAGGGGGGGSIGGGGGAGGYLAYTSQTVAAPTLVTVGAGGGPGGQASNGTSGNNSQFGSLTASAGGGRGGSRGATIAGGSGGSGGGGTGGGAGGAASPSGQGNAGASVSGDVAPAYAGAGGGGAAAAGGGVTSTTGGNGGVGVTTALINSMGAATGTGQGVSTTYYYAGGGAGGTDNPTGGGGTPGTAGLGGGGAAGASRSVSASAGTANTGGGGGGNSNGTGTVGGAGGSGVVIVRYAV